ncbi:MAG: phenylphosphate carboxylase subunit delta [Deltaproteobacteria bacterium CG_4_8_14_3_um_filter_51_11]|nr:HAD hydrolase family protein [bacterium]PIP47054.1 MAG: phenylphosphate carboxylase subunit delta [Deltaproteobacteria bacterium CG23_combo_of_CG06-09_8_20_14_all_51_20]PIV99461.1 MAG: phenylphosphate carboxylase subunit delta [Deltaproteobacteria bacterium CG17_big_fil_post_rev_8_21_14_2_50_51_6]PIX18678.1 MAG: phenylphosphate carboxylase subunit delta [Deltaproteobacteria bacterium CG_4_8_14_3_um_filter_51_11]PIY24421.1 MAG: phenylphosphate carboxylase subunit delta [Deltaproteobacteria ba
MKRSKPPRASGKKNISLTTKALQLHTPQQNKLLNKARDCFVKKARTLKVIFLDVDGVLTDGRIWLIPGGGEAKSFDAKDGVGLKAIINAGIIPVLISGRISEIVERRAMELGIEMVFQAIEDKPGIMHTVLKELGIEPDQTGAMGDDLPDIPMFRETALRFAPADAVPRVIEAADLVTQKPGGRGAVREVCDWLLACRTFPENAFEAGEGE